MASCRELDGEELLVVGGGNEGGVEVELLLASAEVVFLVRHVI